MPNDNLSRVHIKAVWGEMQGRFFSPEEGDLLREAIEDRIIIDPKMRAEAAKTWGRTHPYCRADLTP